MVGFSPTDQAKFSKADIDTANGSTRVQLLEVRKRARAELIEAGYVSIHLGYVKMLAELGVDIQRGPTFNDAGSANFAEAWVWAGMLHFGVPLFGNPSDMAEFEKGTLYKFLDWIECNIDNIQEQRVVITEALLEGKVASELNQAFQCWLRIHPSTDSG